MEKRPDPFSDSYLELSQISKVYETKTEPFVVTEDFDLTIKKGEFVCIIGHSGCGKSTILSIVAGLNESTSGGVILDRKEVVGPGPDRGVVFQSPCLLPWMDALGNVMLGVNQVYWHGTPEERDRIARYYLRMVGLGDALELKPSELSQGMCQRVALARAFALSPKVLLLDEPFGMLDSLTRMELQEALMGLWEDEKMTAVMVTHDVDEALFLADRVVMMTNGPRAKVGQIMEVPFERPRRRSDVLEHPEYYSLRGELIGFLEEQEHLKSQAKAA